MVNWLVGQVLMLGAFGLTSWRSFKAIKSQQVDFSLLKLWSILGLVKFLEDYFEFLISWVPFYFAAKCILLGLLLVPETGLISIVFNSLVVPSMTEIHGILNGVLLPNLIDFIVSIPLKLLIALFPMITFDEGKKDDQNNEVKRLSPLSLSRATAANLKSHGLSSPKNPFLTPEKIFEGDMIEVASDVTTEDENEILAPKVKNGKMTSMLRRVATGDSNIRIRDHLFDIKTPVPPQNLPKAKSKQDARRNSFEKNDSPIRTTRRKSIPKVSSGDNQETKIENDQHSVPTMRKRIPPRSTSS
mmetsp:Transcript_6204/g.8745  ORF Transcript_6204/g.8745 Transcript_6204/m.8745 type:complete len:301 (-) Transcript_6204:99-1001(-)